MRAHGCLARAPFRARSRVRRNAAAMHRPTVQTTAVAEAVRPIYSALMSTEHYSRSLTARTVRSAAQTILYCAPRAATSFATQNRGECRHEDGCSGATLRTRESNDESNGRYAQLRLHDWGMPCALTPARHRRLAGGAEAARSWRRTRAFRASFHGTHDALNVAHTPRLKRTRRKTA